MRKLRGTAFKRWEESRDREAIELAKGVLQEEWALPGNALPGLARTMRARRAADILWVYALTWEMMRGANGDG
jgi:hypothetical protein